MSQSSPQQSYLFTSESVSMGHPDKVSDQVSDAILDSLLEHDPLARVAVETLVTTDYCMVAGEVTVHNDDARKALDNVEQTAREALLRIGYTSDDIGFNGSTCAFVSRIHPQSEDISLGVTQGAGLHDEQGAGDQGLMFGFACDETKQLMPLPIHLSHRLVEYLAEMRETGEIKWLYPDAKSQVTVAYEGGVPVGLHTIVISTQHSADVVDPATNHLSQQAQNEIINKVVKPVIQRECPQLGDNNVIYHINPTGKFVIGGPHGDCGLTGRKIIVDTYGGRGRHGGGAFSGKDPSKVDRSAAYMARHVAKNIVASGLAKECEVQLAYAIGVAEPVSVFINTFGTSELNEQDLANIVRAIFPLTPAEIITYLNLRRPVFSETARHGHFGRDGANFTWEQTNRVNELCEAARQLQVAPS